MSKWPLFSRKRRNRELDEEIQAHLAMATLARVARGESSQAAEEAASREFGNRTLIQEVTREMWGWNSFDTFCQDAHYALRGMLRNPGFTLVAVLSLALGIGANSALFSVVDTLLLKSLPYKDAGRLVYVSEYWPHEPAVPGPPSPDFANWRIKSKTVDGIAAYGGGANALNLYGAGEPERIEGTMVTSGLLGLIGARLTLGRDFTADEDRRGGTPAVILGYGLWQRKMAGSPAVIGKQIQLDGIGRTIVGVLPSGFAFPDNNFHSDLLVPMEVAIDPDWHDQRSFRLLRVIARAKPGVSPSAVRAEFSAILHATASEEPAQMVTMRKDMEVRVTPLRDWLTGGVRRMVLVLQSAVALLLLIACLNVAGLQVARNTSRRKEMAVRAAVGAGRGRLIRQLLTESVILSALGGSAGLALGYWSLRPLRAFLPVDLHLADGIHMDARVLLFTLGIALVAGIASGVAPTVMASRPHLQEAMKEGRTNSPAQQRLHDFLVVAEIALAMVLLIGSGLFVRTFIKLASADPGFRPEGVLTLRISLSSKAYPDAPKWTAFFRQVLDRARAIPGVESAAIGGGLPLIGTGIRAGTAFEGRPQPPLGGRPSIPVADVTAGYFHALGIPILRGRSFTDADENGPRVAIVNQAFAARFFPGEDALGKRIEILSRQGLWREIIGIAGNVKQEGRGPLDSYVIYSPLSQAPESGDLLILKTSGLPPASLVSAATAAVHAVDANQPVFDVATMEERLGESISAQRANMRVMSVFAVLAVVLAAVGIFGVIAYFANQRRQEIGIRLALGSSRAKVLKMILGRGMALTSAGLSLGIAGALILTRGIGSSLEGVRTGDPMVYCAAAGLFALVATAACLIPARAAALIDPAATLRSE